MDGTASPQLEGNTEAPTGWLKTEDRVVFRFRVEGTPKPKARPRTVRNKTTGFVQTYTPSTTVNWEQTIVWQVKQALAWVEAMHPGELTDTLPLQGRILADIRINSVKPKSAPASVLYPLKSMPGDVDNLAKSVLDALQLAGVIMDDKTVTDLFASKRFASESHPEGVEVELTAWI